MASKIEPIVLDGLNYVVWEIDMEMLLKSKGLSKYMKVAILDSSDVATKFAINKKKDEVAGFITTYISCEI
jgi:hypothetical protein